MTEYNYTKEINSDKLLLEIQDTLNLLLDGTDGRINTNGNDVSIYTNDSLSAGDKTILDGIISAHTTSFPEADFNIEAFLLSFGNTFGVLARHQLAKKAPSFITELKFKNFAEIKAIRDYLVTQEEITQAQADTLTSIFAEQNIDLDSYGTTGV